MTEVFSVTAPLPARGSAAALRQQLLEHLLRVRPRVGERFLSDHELSRITQLSRPTVRRALDHLEKEGWIERRPGIGTFIGPRAALGLELSQTGNGNGHGEIRRSVRLALMIHMMGDMGHDWYAAGLINGMDAEAVDARIAVELLGDRSGDVDGVRRRLQQSRPDVLAFAAPTHRHMTLMAAATAMSIPIIGTGTLMERIGVPTATEDGVQGARRAVQHLVEHGHRRIGLILAPVTLPWVFRRRQGYLEALTEAGIEHDGRLELWLPEPDDASRTDALRSFIARENPTALVFASWSFVLGLAPLIRGGEIQVPRDLSVVTFDQAAAVQMWLGVRPTTVALPLVEMGRRLAHMARELAEGKKVQAVTTLPCDLIAGESVAPRGS